MKNKKKIALGATALAVVMVAAGTFAWFSTTDKTAPNIFGMDNFDVTITEAFDKPDVPLIPGTDVTKEVGVTNSGNVPAVVRVKLDEALALLEQDTANGVDKLKVEYADNATAKGAQVPVLISQKMIDAYKAVENDYKDFTTTSYGNLTGITVLRKTSSGTDKANTDKANTDKANTVYSYLAYITEEFSEGSGNHQLVQVTPVIGNGSAENPESFQVKYAYNLKKEEGAQQYIVTATHGKTGEDEKLDKYYGTGEKFHEKAVVLNFDTTVQIDGNALEQGKNWYLASDGYFYYTKALNGESISDPLLKSVSIKESAGNALKGATYTLTPVMEAVQMDWAAVTTTWTNMPGNEVVDNGTGAVVSADGAKQLVYNIIKTNKGYFGT